MFWADKWGTADGSHGLAGNPMSLMEGRIGQIRYLAALLMLKQMVMVVRIVVITLVKS